MKCPQRANLQRQKLDERMSEPAGAVGDRLLMGTRNLLVVLAVLHNCTVEVAAPLCEVIKDTALDALNGCDLWCVSIPQ